jgi:ubiquinone/menaquinone biosynthesis C-methylase UbiE
MTNAHTPDANAKKEYVLGTGDDELARLGFQNRLWSDAAHTLWKLAGIRPGTSILDVGCGPGYAAFDLAQLVGSTGRVLGIDESAGFIAHLNHQANVRGLPHLRGLVGDVQSLHAIENSAAAASIDLAYARWVLCFVPKPQDVINGVAATLKPGAAFCIHDYFNYETMTLAPRSAAFARIVAATGRSWRARGGDPDIMARVPGMLRRAGLRVTHLAVHQRVARPAESMWHWADTWWRIYTPKLVAMGEVTQRDADELMSDLDAAAVSPDTFMQLPPVYEIIGVKN